MRNGYIEINSSSGIPIVSSRGRISGSKHDTKVKFMTMIPFEKNKYRWCHGLGGATVYKTETSLWQCQ